MRRLAGHQEDVQCLAFSPDGRTLATGDDAGKVRLWDVSTATVREEWTTEGMLGGLAWAPDGQELTAGSWAGEVRRWPVSSKDKASASWPDEGRISSVAYSSDGNWLAWCSYRRVVVVARGRTAHNQKIIEPSFNQYCLRFSPSGDTFARAGGGEYLMICDSRTQKVQRRLRHRDKVGCWSLTYTPDGQSLVLGLNRGLQVWSIPRHTRTHQSQDHSDTVTAVSLTADATRLVTAGYDGKVCLYEFHAEGRLGRRLETYDWKLGRLFDLSITPDGTLAAVSGTEGVVLWDLE